MRTSILQVPKVTQRPSFHSGFNTSHTSLGACKTGVRNWWYRTEKVLGGYGNAISTYTCVDSERIELTHRFLRAPISTYTCVNSESDK